VNVLLRALPPGNRCARFAGVFGVSVSSVVKWSQRWRATGCAAARPIVQKKTVLASETERPDIARRRARWLRYQHRIDPRRLVFIDEPKVREAKPG
jgi:transposase